MADVPGDDTTGARKVARVMAADAGWTAAAVAPALERDAHTIGQWTTAFAKSGLGVLSFEQSGGSPSR